MKISLMALVVGFCLVAGLPLTATAGPTPGGPVGTDGDGLEDYFDNCYKIANPDQKDTDHDGCGNACDCDFNNDGVCSGLDTSAIIASLFHPVGGPGTPDPLFNPDTDMNCDGVTSLADFSSFIPGFLLPMSDKSGFPGTTGPPGVESQRCAWCGGPYFGPGGCP